MCLVLGQDRNDMHEITIVQEYSLENHPYQLLSKISDIVCTWILPRHPLQLREQLASLSRSCYIRRGSIPRVVRPQARQLESVGMSIQKVAELETLQLVTTKSDIPITSNLETLRQEGLT